MLSTRKLSLKTFRIKTISHKFIGPIAAVKNFDVQSYPLYLSSELRSMHHTFHISLIKKFEQDTFNRNSDKISEATTKNFKSIYEIINYDYLRIRKRK